MTANNPIRNQADFWDHYTDHDFPARQARSKMSLEMPGDEWMPREFWNKLVPTVLISRLDADEPVLVEIGAGAGKQTKIVLEHKPGAKIYSFDISASFIRSFEKYLGETAGDRVEAILLGKDWRQMLRDLSHRGAAGKVDAFYAFDAMVHVDLQALMAYFITAVHALKPGGFIVMDVADSTSDLGFSKLLNDVKHYYPFHGAPCAKFMFTSPAIIEDILVKLGFTVEFIPDERGHCLFVARLADREAGLRTLEPVAEDWTF